MWVACIAYYPTELDPYPPILLSAYPRGHINSMCGQFIRECRFSTQPPDQLALNHQPPTSNRQGGKDKGGSALGHNNDKDFQRRLDVWKKARQEDADDLAARVGPGLTNIELKQAE